MREEESINLMLGLDETALTTNLTILQALLASEYVLATKMRNFHWNVKGPTFMMLHEMFGEMYTALNNLADEVAERIRQLDGRPEGTLEAFKRDSFLGEEPCPYNAEQMIKCLIDDSDIMVGQMRVAIKTTDKNNDFGTMDLITKWMEVHEKQLYFLRSHCG